MTFHNFRSVRTNSAQLPHRAPHRHLRGQAGLEHAIVVALVGIVGVAGFQTLGSSMGESIDGDAARSAPRIGYADGSRTPDARPEPNRGRVVSLSTQASTLESLARMAEKVGGMERELADLHEVVSLRLNDNYRLARAGVESPPRGVILHGPPGTGKTLLGKTVAEEMGARLFFVNGAELAQPKVGAGEAILRELFTEAREAGPSVIMFDEIDALAGTRGDVPHYARSVLTQFLSLMSEIKDDEKLVVLGTTNLIDDIDPAIRRPGRFDREIEVGLPDEKGIRKILQIHTKSMRLADDVDLNELSQRLKGYVGADIQAVATEAGLEVVRRLDRSGDHADLVNGLIEQWKGKFLQRMPREMVFKVVRIDEKNHVIMSLGDYAGQPLPPRSMTAVNEHFRIVKDATTPDALKDLIRSAEESGEALPSGHVIGRVPLSEADKQVFVQLAQQEGKLVDLLQETLPQEIEQSLAAVKEPVTKADFEKAIKKIKPSATRENHIDVSGTTWDDIGGYDDVKEEIFDRVVLPLKHPERLRRLGYDTVPQHVILEGPSGTGKTLFAKAIANEVDANVITVKLSDVTSKWINEGPAKIKEIFRRCRNAKPCVLIMDEIDAVMKSREGGGAHAEDQKVVNAFLSELDGLDNNEGVIIVGTTNHAASLDGALLRPGRFGGTIHVGLPDSAAREKIFGVHLRGKQVAEGLDVGALVDKTEGFSGAEIEQVVQDAGLIAAKADERRVPLEAFDKAIEKAKKRRASAASSDGSTPKRPIGFNTSRD